MDNIAIINGQEAMAYQGEMPWHRLGTPMEEADVNLALKKGVLDWEVFLEPMYLKSGVVVPNKNAVVRDIDNEILGVVGNSYAPIQNAEAFGVLIPACKEHGVTIESAGALGKGEQVWMLAKMPESIEPMPGDKVDGYFLISTGHNGIVPYTYRLTPIRVVCQNTLNRAEAGEALGKLHHYKSDTVLLNEVEKLITNLVYALKVTGECFAELAAKKWNLEQVQSYIDEVCGIADSVSVETVVAQLLEVKPETESAQMKQRNEILNLVWNGKGSELAGSKRGNKTTAWAAYNAVTEYVDHVRPANQKSEKSIAAANKSALFGSNAAMKQRAFSLAMAA